MAQDDSTGSPVTLETLVAAGPEQPIARSRSVDCAALWQLYARARDKAETAGEADRAASYNLLANACSLALRPVEALRPFAPMLEMTFGSSPRPEAFDRAQAAIFADLAPTIAHPALRARLGDLGWVNAKRHDAARTAIAAYIDCVKMLLAGRGARTGKPAEASGYRGLDLLHRATVIQRQLGWGEGHTDDLVDAARKIRLQAARRKDLFGFVRIAEFELEMRLAKPLALARMAERLALAQAGDDEGHALESLWSLAATAYQRAERRADADRALIELAEWQVRTADRKSNIPMQETHWLERAIATLRRFKGTNERRAELQARLVRAQDNLQDFMVPSSLSTNIKDLVEATQEGLRDKTLIDALFRYADSCRSPAISGLREKAATSFAASPFAGLFAPVIFDAKGKMVSRLPAVDFGRPPDERNLRFKIIEHEQMRRALTVAGQLEPGRIQIVLDHQPDERVLTKLAELSPFVPPRHALFFGRGMAHYFNADFTDCAHLLVPQLEPLLRHVLAAHDIDTTRFKGDATQSSATLSVLLQDGGELRTSLEEILGDNTVFEIENIFDHGDGPALRHRMAHGLLNQWFFTGTDVRYACWLLLRLCLLPLIPHAEEVRRRLGEPPT